MLICNLGVQSGGWTNHFFNFWEMYHAVYPVIDTFSKIWVFWWIFMTIKNVTNMIHVHDIKIIIHFPLIQRSYLRRVEWILNGPITKFCNSDFINATMAENLIWSVFFFYFSVHGDWQRNNIYLQYCSIKSIFRITNFNTFLYFWSIVNIIALSILYAKHSDKHNDQQFKRLQSMLNLEWPNMHMWIW